MDMSIFIIVMIVVITSVILKSIKDKDSSKKPVQIKQADVKQKETSENKDLKLTGEEVQTEVGARDLLIRVLMQMGCQYTADENQRVSFVYQGEHFLANATNDQPFIVIIDPWWLNCELQDVEQVVKIKNAVNVVNRDTFVNTFYHIDDDAKRIGVHSDKNILFIPEIPEIERYLRSVLDMFFSSHRQMLLEVDRQKIS